MYNITYLRAVILCHFVSINDVIVHYKSFIYSSKKITWSKLKIQCSLKKNRLTVCTSIPYRVVSFIFQIPTSSSTSYIQCSECTEAHFHPNHVLKFAIFHFLSSQNSMLCGSRNVGFSLENGLQTTFSHDIQGKNAITSNKITTTCLLSYYISFKLLFAKQQITIIVFWALKCNWHECTKFFSDVYTFSKVENIIFKLGHT